MPILPPSSIAPVDYVYQVLNSAKGRLNDSLPTLAPIGGSILDLQSAQTQQFTNNAWRKFMDFLADRGYSDLIGDEILYSLPIVASSDPASQAWISWTGCFDGQNYFQTPALPPDLTHPMRLWERYSGQNACFTPMTKWLDGLPTPQKQTYNRIWEWRGNAIYMPGSTSIEDIRIRYTRHFSDFLDVGNVQWFNQPVPIVRASDSLSWLLCYEVVSARGGPSDMAQANVFMQNAMRTLDHLFNLDVNANQRVNLTRQPRSRRRGAIGQNCW